MSWNICPALKSALISVAGAALFLSSLLTLIPTPALALGNFHGHARFERVKGDASKGYIELYEYKAFLTRTGSGGSGYSYHIGDPGTAQHPYEGCITWNNIPAGTYTLFTAWPEFGWRGKIVSGVVINDNQTTQQNADEPIDYSGYYTISDWDPTGGNPVYQTFLSTGTSITRVAFKKADSDSTGQVSFSIHQSNGGNVETWPQVGPTRTRGRQGYNSDMWVSWDAGEVTTTPGQMYAVRLSPSTGVNLQPYWSPDSFYPQGTGYRGGQSSPAGHDYSIAVFADNDNTINTISNRANPYVTLAGWWDRWAQSYTARGTSFAASSLMGTIGGQGGWQFSVDVSVHAGTPAGTQVGPTKTMPCAFAPFAGNAGVAFAPGEVPTTPGQTYWVVYQRTGGGGFNAYQANGGNNYAGGTAAYYNGSWNTTGLDLFMNLYEYATTGPTPTPAPTNTPTPTPIGGANLLDGRNPSFETSSGSTHPSWTNNTQFGTNGAFPNPSTAHHGAQWASFSYGGGGSQVHDLYQTLTVTAGHTYNLSAWTHVGGTDGTVVASLRWVNGSYGGTGSGTLVQSADWVGGQPIGTWQRLSGNVTPTGTQLTFILRSSITGWGGGTNFDDCSVIDQSVSVNTPTPTPTSPPPTATPTATATPPGATATPTPPFSSTGAGWRENR